MKISVKSNVAEVRAQFQAFAQNQANTLLSRALNRTAEEAQTRMRQGLYTRFNIRSPNTAQFFEKLVKIRTDDRATPDRLTARVRIEGTETGGPSASLRAKTILYKHEDGGTFSGDATRFGRFYIPNRALRAGSAGVPRSLYPSALGLESRRKIEGGFTRATTHAKKKGRLGVYVVPNLGIFERYGPGRKDTSLLWVFARRIHLRPRLRFHETVDRTVRERIGVNVAGYLDAAVATQARRVARGG